MKKHKCTYNNFFKKGIFLFLVLLNFNGIAQEEKTKPKLKDIVAISGYVKYLNQTAIKNKNSIINDNIIHNRLNLKAYLNKNFEIKLETRNRIFYGETIKQNHLYASYLEEDDGLIDLSWNLISGKDIILNTKIDRAYLNYYKGKFNIKIGRQRINWAITNIWNPNDLFNAYNFLDFDYEEKPGTDALRVEYAMKGMSTLEFAYSPAKTLDETTVAFLYKFNKWKYDFQVLGANYNKDLALGLGWAGAIKSIGFKGESTYFQPREDFSKAKGILATSLGFDYSFKKGIYANLGYMYNSDGINNKLPIVPTGSQVLSGKLSPKSLMPSKYSFFIQAQQNFGPAWSANVSVLYGAGMHLVAFVPNISYSIKDNWDIDLTAQSFFIQANKFENIGNQVSLRLRYSY